MSSNYYSEVRASGSPATWSAGIVARKEVSRLAVCADWKAALHVPLGTTSFWKI
jgi:hypothetical protein